MAKRHQLCFRCLQEWHSGKSCPRSRQCEQNGCQESHHWLLHKNGNRERLDFKTVSHKGQITYGTEGNEHTQQTTMTTRDNAEVNLIALRTLPVVLKNGCQSMCVNALLDDASTQTYINTDIASELGLQGEKEKVKVNVLNGHIETLETMPVNVTLESVNGDVNVKVNARTTERVTGNMAVVD